MCYNLHRGDTMWHEEVSKEINEVERVNRIYEVFDENSRLNRSKAARVEFLTTIKYIDKYLKQDQKILDIGAGAGEYSFHYARLGYDVTAVELADNNVKVFREKMTPKDKIDLRQANACDLSMFEDKVFDVIFLFGPLYHISDLMDRQKCINEAKRVCKDDGVIFVSYISHDFIFLTELSYNPHYFLTNDFDSETMRLRDFPFVFKTVQETRKEMSDNYKIIHEISADGASELMEKVIDQFDDIEYQRYLNYHWTICEKPEMLGMCNHLLYVCKK